MVMVTVGGVAFEDALAEVVRLAVLRSMELE
jgi:hypothetical protein